jgi:autoinducer 2-degrading protein
MHIVLVHVHVKTNCVDKFIQLSLDNAANSRKESGIVRFDLLQEAEDPTRFTLVEVYKKAEDQVKHRETSHYLTWRDKVGDLMAEPRQGIKYINIDPKDEEWN